MSNKEPKKAEHCATPRGKQSKQSHFSRQWRKPMRQPKSERTDPERLGSYNGTGMVERQGIDKSLFTDVAAGAPAELTIQRPARMPGVWSDFCFGPLWTGVTLCKISGGSRRRTHLILVCSLDALCFR